MSVLLVACFFSLATFGIDPPIDETPCSQEDALEAEPQDPCVGHLVLPAQMYMRTTGAPNTFTASFATPHDGVICVRVLNGNDDNRTRISAGWINVDHDPLDNPVIGPGSFGKQVLDIEREHELAAGQHELRVRLASQPGAFVTVEVRFASLFTEEEVTAQEELAELRQLTCDQRNDQLARLGSPEEADRRREQGIAVGTAPGEMRVRGNVYGVPRRLDPLPSVDVGQTAEDPPEVVAEKWLEHFRGLLRWTDSDIDLVLDYVKPSVHFGRARVRLRETMGGLPVDGAALELVVWLDLEGVPQVQRLVGNFVPDVPESLVPSLAGHEAVERVLLLMGSDDTAISEPMLVVLDNSVNTGLPEVRLAWRMAIASPPPAFVGKVWIDANTGALLAQTSLSLEAGTQVYEAQPVPGIDNDEIDPADPATWDGLSVVRDDGLGIDSCSGVEWCENVRATIERLDQELRLNFGRDGWSGDGLSDIDLDGDGFDDPGTGIEPNDDYRLVLARRPSPGGLWNYVAPGVVFDPHGVPANICFVPYVWMQCYIFPSRAPLARGDHRYTVINTKTAFITPIPGGVAYSPDVVRHEFGHGFHLVEVGIRGTLLDTITPTLVAISESVGDFWAMTNTEDVSPFLIEHQVGVVIRDNTTFEPIDDGGCNSFVHLSFFGDPTTTSPHRNACILNRVAVRAMDDTTPITAHGITSRGVGVTTAAFLFYQLYTEHLTATDDFLDWADNYREAVLTLAQKCEFDPTATACPQDRDPLLDAIDPLWGTGFYSDPIDLSGVDMELQTMTTPAAVVVDGRVHLFYTGKAGALFVAGFRDPINKTSPIGPTNLTDLLPATEKTTAFAVASADADTIHLAFVDFHANLRVAQIKLGAGGTVVGAAEDTGTPGLTERKALNDSPAIIHDDSGNWHVVFVDSETSKLRVVGQGESSSSLVAALGEGVTAPARTPHLAGAPDGAVLLYRLPSQHVMARRMFLDDTREFGFQDAVRTFTSFTAPGKLTISTGPLAATVFPSSSPRLQILLNTPTISPAGATTTLDQLTVGAPPAGDIDVIYPAGTQSRAPGVIEGGANGAAVVRFDHPKHGEILLVYYNGPPSIGASSHILVSYKKSD